MKKEEKKGNWFKLKDVLRTVGIRNFLSISESIWIMRKMLEIK